MNGRSSITRGFLSSAAVTWAFLIGVGMASHVLAAGQNPSQTLAEELPRIPPVDPAKALSTFQLQHGFRLELFAAEPQVASPVDACFDENGRLYVAEMRDYPFSWEPTKLNPKGGGKKDAGVVRLLEDTNGDGKADRSVIFADTLTWPTSVCCYNGGLFVLAPPHLYYFKDLDGDGKADVRQIVLSGFGRDNVQAVANNLKWSLDNRIVFAAGRNGGDLIRDGKRVFSIHGQDLAFNPATGEVSALTGGEQFGLSFDDWGNRFVCSNSNHIEQVLFEDRYVVRNPYFVVSGAIATIGKEGAAAPVFRRSPPEPWRVVRTRRRVSDPAMLRNLPRTEQFAIGFFTSAAGVTIYRGDAYPPPFQGNAFIGDVGGNLIHRKTVTRSGANLSATRADENVEFVASTDNWFRPVNFLNAPDGCLYILDMYRETIEHPFSIPEDIKAHLDLQSGDDRGRIYRLVPPGPHKARPLRLGKFRSADLVAQLESANGWNRETAQRLLWERQDREAIPRLVQLVRGSSAALARLHALHVLNGLGSLSDEVLRVALSDTEPRIRAHAVRLSEPRLRRSPGLFAAVSRLAADRDPLVRFQLALSLGEADPWNSVEPLAELSQEAAADETLRTALMTSVRGNAERIAVKLLGEAAFLRQSGSTVVLAELAATSGAQPISTRAIALLHGLFAARCDAAHQLAVLHGLGQGLSRRGLTISALLAEPGTDPALTHAAAALFKSAGLAAGDASQRDSAREAAIGLLGFASFEQASPVLSSLLTPQTPPALQSAAVAAFSAQTHADVGRHLLAGWKGYGPQVRRDVVDALSRSSSRLGDLFDAIASHRVAAGEIDRDVKQVLLNHPDARIRRRARQLFEADVPGDRAKTVAQYRPALDRSGNSDLGRAVYEKRCASCHRAGNAGHAVGPDLVSVQNKSPSDMLISILDPSREAQPNFIAYNVVTNSGTIHNGIIAAESAAAVTLRRAEGKEDQILRSQIDELVSTGKSLMPDGFEKDISPAQMADLIAFIKTIPPAVAPK